ncbi:IPExxxVDY family protein [Altibacter lentus]|uniref:IPExxxVDY family protein n=1 Tax=Altibacter lentus TaxID=1223410 RepID=UPI00054D63AD|nr:IPExxxVDY family protein [Altibacter lentus]
MVHHKLVLEDDFKETYSLLAIHCSEEAYKVAYLINQFVGLKLQRNNRDLEFSNNGLEVSFPRFIYDNEEQYTTYDLVANKCRSVVANVHSSGGLFTENASETVTTRLIPEFKKVDYFLKIISDFELIPLRKLISDINEIKQVISAYPVDVDSVKSKRNLIFD